ncbi:hypothetical protein ABT272_15915 [Streptomyces sp900105245]|uniref:Uncharacterized protein n=1 Tax=Streptomyces sp. 900105245 TaxID=3154379 RepID=A0ABV1U660_9ACTN
MKDSIDFDTGGEQRGAGRVDIGDDQIFLPERGAADVRPVPNWTEHAEPCGVNWTTPGGVWSSLQPRRP